MGNGHDTKPIRSYRDLLAWQRAFALGAGVYAATHAFPDDERFGLSAQAPRSSVSIARNIAEGYGRGGRAEYLRFLKIARGSLFELETQLLFAAEFGCLTPERARGLTDQINDTARVLSGLITSLSGSGA